jgi:hypothetical protein
MLGVGVMFQVNSTLQGTPALILTNVLLELLPVKVQPDEVETVQPTGKK